MKLLVTGGAGFIGSAVARMAISRGDSVVVLDKLTYAGNLESLAPVADSPLFAFEQVDICDAAAVRAVLLKHRPDAVVHLAAESHVDRSIDGPGEFVQTNVVGTFVMLQESLGYWRTLAEGPKAAFRFHHVSTDEVFGSLGETGAFTETTAYDPRSPYSASKAASDHFVRAWHHTYGLPVVMTNCSNNYGPYHFPEKLIPLMIVKCLAGEPLPVYGKGENVRDWLYVDDHADAILAVCARGRVGESYNIGGNSEVKNIDVVLRLCRLMDELAPANAPHEKLITYVADRPGHDLRYAMDIAKVESELGWTPRQTFESGLRSTVIWYLENRGWWERIRNGNYRQQRLGLEQK